MLPVSFGSVNEYKINLHKVIKYSLMQLKTRLSEGEMHKFNVLHKVQSINKKLFSNLD
jgi:hypothetical protein